MTDRIHELEQDIQELKTLLLDSERPNIQNHLSQHLSKLKTELDNLNSTKLSELPKPQAVPVSVEPKHEAKQVNYVTLTKYAWDQEGSKVKIIFSMDGVGKQCTKEDVDAVFGKNSVEMKLRGYNNQNLIFGIKALFADINPAESKFLIKNNSVYLILIKKENKSWDQIGFKENKLKTNEKEEAKDPQAGLMNMMKNMYDGGDEGMKRSIAEAWTKANDKKEGKDKPDFSDRYDFLNK